MSRSRKLAPIVALAMAIALLVAGVAIAVYNERSYRAQKTSDFLVQARILASSVTAALAFDDDRAAQEYVNALRANPEVEAAAVYAADGSLFASYARTAEPPLPEKVALDAPSLNNDRLVITVPVAEERAHLGIVYLRTITEPLERRLVRHGALILLITMASLVVAVLGFAQSALARANAELRSQARDLAEANRNLHAQIEEREKAEEALRQSQKMEAIGQLSGGIAHDFNNLLTVVKGNLQLLQKRIARGRTDVTQYVDFAMEGLNRAASVTQRILAFSRRQPLSPRPVDLSRLVEGMDELLRHSLGAMIEKEMRLEADWWTLCDPNQMENVILNLVINARDAMPEGGRIEVRTANLELAVQEPGLDGVPPGEYVALTVADTGVGMSDEVRLKAVDPFFTTKPQGQGTGLGLSMIFGYVKQSRGHLNIASAPGKGTKVTILMPRYSGEVVADEAPEAEADRPPEPAAPAAQRPRVLVVEDEALVRMLAVETIRDEGFEVLEEAHGDTAMAVLLSDTPIDLLITDVKLPGANGYQLAEAGIARRPGLKVLLMTGYSQDPVPETLTAAGARIIYKPYAVEDLAALAKRILAEEAQPASA